MSDSLRPHGLQQARLPCPSPTPGACSNSCPSSRWCHPTFSSSVVPFSSCLQSFPASMFQGCPQSTPPHSNHPGPLNSPAMDILHIFHISLSFRIFFLPWVPNSSPLFTWSQVWDDTQLPWVSTPKRAWSPNSLFPLKFYQPALVPSRYLWAHSFSFLQLD